MTKKSRPVVAKRMARAALLAPAAIILSLVAGALLAPAASAAPAAPAAAAAAAAAAVPSSSSLGSSVPTLGTPGNGVKFEVRSKSGSPDQYSPTNVAVYDDGRVKFIADGKCLDTWSYNGIEPWRNVGIYWNCIENPSQAYYFVPANNQPSAAAGSSASDHWFYIVSESGKMCFSSSLTLAFARLTPCQAGSTSQQFRILNDPADAQGVNRQWENILGLALKYATNHCATYTGPDENSPCFVSTASSVAGATWSAAGSQAANSLGTLTTRSAGCGTTLSTTLPTMHNATVNPIPVTLTTQGSYAHQVTVGNTETVTGSFTLTEGVKDVWSTSGTISFQWQHQEVTVNTKTETNTTTVNPTVQPGDWLMGTWESQVLEFTGYWKLGVDTPSTDQGSLTWYMPSTSILPAALTSTKTSPLTFTPVTSHTQKDCDAGPASINTAAPTLAGNAACTTAAVARARTTVYACPGTWAIPGVNPTPRYAYQWYTIPQGGTTASLIPGATASSYTVSEQILPASPAVAYLGVIVTEIGPMSRRESVPAPTLVTAQLLPALAGSPLHSATNFVGLVPNAMLGDDYSADVVAESGSGMQITSDTSDLPGLSISADGVLSGIPSAVGDYEFSVMDTPSDGGAAQTASFVLHVAAPPTEYASDAALSGTVGQPLSADLVSSDAAGQSLDLTGDLPLGVTFDPTTGSLTGTPLTAGDFDITVTSTWSSASFTLTVSDAATTLSPDALPGGSVGVAYSARTVSNLGSNVQIGLVGSSPTGLLDAGAAPTGQLEEPDLAAYGLSLHSSTGEISGTPTKAGTITLVVANLSDQGGPTVTKTISITAGGVSSATAANGTLAATGSNAGELILAALLLTALGAATTVMRRRRVG